MLYVMGTAVENDLGFAVDPSLHRAKTQRVSPETWVAGTLTAQLAPGVQTSDVVAVEYVPAAQPEPVTVRDAGADYET